MITWGTGYLTEKKIDDARLTMELLLSAVLQTARIQLYTNFDKPLAEDELTRLKSFLQRRLNREPLQYILGSTEFMGLSFRVTPDVLIPRPETELLVEETTKALKAQFGSEQPLRIADLGTGSGCIAVSLAKALPNAEIIAADISEAALTVARSNAERNGVLERIVFTQWDLMSDDHTPIPTDCHCIVSNPPYISQEEFRLVSREVKDFEPAVALTDAKDGLSFYPAIAAVAKSVLVPNGILAVEHAFDQSDNVRRILESNGFRIHSIVPDYQKIPRHIIAVNS